MKIFLKDEDIIILDCEQLQQIWGTLICIVLLLSPLNYRYSLEYLDNKMRLINDIGPVVSSKIYNAIYP